MFYVVENKQVANFSEYMASLHNLEVHNERPVERTVNGISTTVLAEFENETEAFNWIHKNFSDALYDPAHVANHDLNIVGVWSFLEHSSEESAND